METFFCKRFLISGANPPPLCQTPACPPSFKMTYRFAYYHTTYLLLSAFIIQLLGVFFNSKFKKIRKIFISPNICSSQSILCNQRLRRKVVWQAEAFPPLPPTLWPKHQPAESVFAISIELLEDIFFLRSVIKACMMMNTHKSAPMTILVHHADNVP